MIIEGANRNAFLDKKELQDGEFLQINGEGWREESKKYTNKDGSPKVRYMFNVKRLNEVLTTEFNWTSVKELCSVYGSETNDWNGKWVKVSKVFDPAKKMLMIYFLPVEKKQSDILDKGEAAKAAREEKPKTGNPDGAISPDEINWEA